MSLEQAVGCSVFSGDPLKNIHEIVKNHACELSTMYHAGIELDEACGKYVNQAKAHSLYLLLR